MGVHIISSLYNMGMLALTSFPILYRRIFVYPHVKFLPYYIGKILCKRSALLNIVILHLEISMRSIPMQNSSTNTLYIQERFCIPHANYSPYYIVKILCTLCKMPPCYFIYIPQEELCIPHLKCLLYCIGKILHIPHVMSPSGLSPYTTLSSYTNS